MVVVAIVLGATVGEEGVGEASLHVNVGDEGAIDVPSDTPASLI